MKEIKPLEQENPTISVFLAGSIEMGVASNWQAKVIKELKDTHIIVYNPRRDDWDNSWGPMSKELKDQINWELDNLEKADYIFMYLDPKTKSPISLLEFGMYAKSGKLIVVCDPNFYRYTNVMITAEKYTIPVFRTISNGLEFLKYKL